MDGERPMLCDICMGDASFAGRAGGAGAAAGAAAGSLAASMVASGSAAVGKVSTGVSAPLSLISLVGSTASSTGAAFLAVDFVGTWLGNSC
jgi:hypothetical protein